MKTSRKEFIKTLSAASLFSIAPARVLFGAQTPSNMLTRALIGFGGIAHSENHLGFRGSRLIGLCDPWETSGFFARRDGSSADYLTPVALTFGREIGQGDLAVIYLEDADTDGDGLPDAWEYVEKGNLTAWGVEKLSETKAGEYLYAAAELGGNGGELELKENAKLPEAGLAGRIGNIFSNAGLMALALGAPVERYDSFEAAIDASLSPELVEGGVKIASLDLTGGKVTIALDIETTTASSSSLTKLFDQNGQLNVACKVLWTPTLAETPTVIHTEIVPVGAGAVELDVSEALRQAQEKSGVSGASGFFSVSVEKQ